MKLNVSYLLAALLLVSGAAFAADKPIAKVNGAPISAAVNNALLEEQVQQGAQVTDELRKAARDELIRREVLAQDAHKKAMDKNPDVAARMELARQAVLVGYYVDQWVKNNPITDDKAKAEYDRYVTTMPDLEYKARHILVDKEEDAKAIITKLQTGAKFDDLAKDSKDPGSKDNGGDLGWAPAQTYVQPFADALRKLEKGKFTAVPVQTQFGYHVIMLDDTRKPEPPKFEEVKERIRQNLQQQALSKFVTDMVAKAKVE